MHLLAALRSCLCLALLTGCARACEAPAVGPGERSAPLGVAATGGEATTRPAAAPAPAPFAPGAGSESDQSFMGGGTGTPPAKPSPAPAPGP